MEEDKKKKDKPDDENNDKDGTMGFQQLANRVNMIKREINKMISKNYLQDLALYILKESTRSSSA